MLQPEPILGILLLFVGCREMQRQYARLRNIAQFGEKKPFAAWGHRCMLTLGAGITLIGVGAFVQQALPVGWILAGLGPLCALPVDCAFAVINRVTILKALRNLFFIALGMLFIGHGLGLW